MKKKLLTIAGQLLFEDTVNKCWAVLSKIKRKIDDEIFHGIYTKEKDSNNCKVKPNKIS